MFLVILMENCNMCPRKCNVNRDVVLGFCGMPRQLIIAKYDLHMWEEPSISGTRGSGTIFFSGCNLKCIFCQNKEISHYRVGKAVSVEKLADICLELQSRGAHNINLVTPSHYTSLIRDALLLAKKQGLAIPIIYNSGGYDAVDSLKLLEGLIDIYIPDFKYYDNNLAHSFSLVNNYEEIVKKAIQEMYRQVGENVFDNDGMMKKGIIVRHLILPGHIDDSKRIIKYLCQVYRDNIYVSLMNQYTPMEELKYRELNRSLEKKEYDSVINYGVRVGITRAYIQEEGTSSKDFIPRFED